nr:MAG TPA: hypothetical protein [Caudoviricetes sp.]
MSNTNIINLCKFLKNSTKKIQEVFKSKNLSNPLLHIGFERFS